MVLTISTLAGCSEKPEVRPERETWDLIRIEGTRVGHAHARLFRETRDGRPVVRVVGRQHLAIERFNQPTEVDITFTNIETPQGKLIEFETEITL